MVKFVLTCVICKPSDVERIYEPFFIVLLSEKLYTLTGSALINVQNILDDTDSEMTKFEGGSQSSSSDNYVEYAKGKTKVDSPFNRRFTEIVNTTTEALEKFIDQEIEIKEVNALYCPSFFDYVQTRLMPLLPLWNFLTQTSKIISK